MSHAVTAEYKRFLKSSKAAYISPGTTPLMERLSIPLLMKAKKASFSREESGSMFVMFLKAGKKPLKREK